MLLAYASTKSAISAIFWALEKGLSSMTSFKTLSNRLVLQSTVLLKSFGAQVKQSVLGGLSNW